MRAALAGLLALCVALGSAQPASAARYTLIGWNNLGMHCMDGDYSVLSLLPPYNTIHAQLVSPTGALVSDPTAAGITVTYQAVADPDGSINTTSLNKTNFWDNVAKLFGVSLPVDAGLAGSSMPGHTNAPQPMRWDAASAWFIAEGIPITPYDDAGRKVYYPMMRLVARDAGGNQIASTDIVLPVSDEMDCSACHSNGSGVAARPVAGWATDANPQRELRLNILRLHDEKQAGDPQFAAALAAVGYDPAGLEQTVVAKGTSILCASCHLSEALPGSGQPGIKPLTTAIHGLHGGVTDPQNGLTLDASGNRAACYRCHPGSVTRCLRGAMGSAVAADGSLEMQCQSCHGTMSAVADPLRTGWFDEPSCQNCHTGTATTNSGQIRFTSALDAQGHRRQPADPTFATNDDTPVAGVNLYRFSSGHGGLKCESCHGSTHAEFPSSHRNDNLQSIALQGHSGMLSECTTCHATSPQTISGGPHGMHPVGQVWVNRHHDVVGEGGASTAQCRSCHGADYRGTVLSRVQADRVLTGENFGTKQVWRGFQIGCYGCHNGPSSDDRNPNRAPVVTDATISAAKNTPAAVALNASDADGNALTLRIVSQPSHGTAGLNGRTATYNPDPGYVGADQFTFAAWDGSTDSNLGTVRVNVSGNAGGPDLAVAWVLPASQKCTTPGGVLRCKVRGRVAITNGGTVAAPATTVRFYLSADSTLDAGDTLLSERSVPALAVGKKRAKPIGTALLPSGTNATGKYVLAVADGAGAIAEANEANNLAVSGPLLASP